MSASLAVATPVAAAVERAAQPPRLLDQVAEAARKRGASEPTTEQLASWVRAYIVFHGKQHPRDLGLPAVSRFLQHVVRTEKPPLPALEAARAALELLYNHVLSMDLGELPRPQPLRLLDQMSQVLRVRHYSPRTEACYLHWARHFILFHGKRHARHPVKCLRRAVERRSRQRLPTGRASLLGNHILRLCLPDDQIQQRGRLERLHDSETFMPAPSAATAD